MNNSHDVRVNFANSNLAQKGPQVILEDFKSYLLKEDRKLRTVQRHLVNLRRLQAYCPNFNYEEIEKYFLDLKEQGCKNTYLNSLISTIRLYAKCKSLGSELQSFKFRKKELFSKATLSDEEIESFLNLPPEQLKRRHWRTNQIFYCPSNPKLYQRWTVFFSIMAFTGMRPGEVANLKVDDVDFGRQVFVIRDSKTNTPRIAPIAANIIKLVHEYLDNLKGELLFASSQKSANTVFDNVDWHYNFHKRLKRLNIKRTNLTPYSLRHSYATRLLEEDVSLFHVKKLLGHSDLKSTLVYEHLTTKDLIKAQNKLPLVRRDTNPKDIMRALCECIKGFNLEKDPRFKYQYIEDGDSIRFECNILDVE